MDLSKLWEMAKDRGTWHAVVHGMQRVRHNLATEQQLVNSQTSEYQTLIGELC